MMKYLLILKQKLEEALKRMDREQLKIALIAALVIAFGAAGYNYLATTRIRCATVTLNYEEAKQGLNPDGSKFNIADIKSDAVLQNALGILGDDRLSADEVRERISIDAKMPISAIDRTKNAIASGSTYNYNPSEFDIYYSQERKLGRNNTVAFLEALSEAYYEHFITTYSDKNVILEFDGADDFEDYDYYEIYKVLENKVNSMINYLGTHQEESTTFHSTHTGYSFENLTSMLINLRDKDLEKLRAYIIQNKISKDPNDFIGKQQYLISKQMLNYNSNMQASDIVNSALLIYDPHITGIAFIPSVDDEQEYYMGRTKTGIDNLAKDSYDRGARAKSLKKSIDERNYLVGKFTADTYQPADAHSVADKMIVDICVFLEKISTVAVLTDNDYISYKANDYITFNLPKNKLYLPIIPFVTAFVIGLCVCVAGIRVYSVTLDRWKKRSSVAAEKAEEDTER